MKALPFKIAKSSVDTLIIQEDKGMSFYDAFHQHEEIQISWVVSGEGNLIIGDNIKSFKCDDILIFGSRVPHMFKSSEIQTECHMISLFFTKESFGDNFFGLAEFESLLDLFPDMEYGIKIVDQKEKIKEKFLEIKSKRNRLERLIIFLQVLKILSESKIETISSSIAKKNYSDNEGQRMGKIFKLVMENFHKDITLQEASSIANMTPNAFCRYFKQRTNKTFFQFLTEIRIENCCRILTKHPDLSIAEVSYTSGFKNLSHFNRKFKKIKGITPSIYKKDLMKALYIK